MKHVAIFGVPRSGTSWLGQIFNSSSHVVYRFQPIFSYSFSSNIDENSGGKEIKKFYNELIATEDPFVCQKKSISGNSTPDFSKTKTTHLVWKEVHYINIIANLLEQSETKVVGIIRHPCGVIKSWYNSPKGFQRKWQLSEEWQYALKKNEDKYHFFGYERWIKAAQIFQKLEKKYPNRFYIQIYEDLLQRTGKEMSKLFTFAGLNVGRQTQQFLEESTSSASNDPYGVFRSPKTGYEWYDTLDPKIIEQIYADERFEAIRKEFKWKTLNEI